MDRELEWYEIAGMKHNLDFRLLPIAFFFLSFTFTAFSGPDSLKKSKPGQRIFDGKSLKGWKAPDMSYWSVKEGAITASSTADHPCTHNQFLVWQGGDVGNFSLALKFRLRGGPNANSGVQVRSRIKPDGHVFGYQVDISQPEIAWLGGVYDELGRKVLASRGQKTVIESNGTMKRSALQNGPDAVTGIYKKGEWNEYRIQFKDNRVEVKLNGMITAIVIDNQESEREMSGVLALQLHSGPAMTVQFKDIVLRKLDH